MRVMLLLRSVKKEWFALLVREIFDPKYGMFAFNASSRVRAGAL
jgi:hypothetical protein